MKLYKDPITSEVYAYEADGSQDDHIPDHLVAITEVEANALRFPEPDFSIRKSAKLHQIDAIICDMEGVADRALRELVQPSSPSFARMQHIEAEVAPMRIKRAAIVAAADQAALDAIPI